MSRWRIRAPRKWAPRRASPILQVPQVRRIRSPHDSAPQTHLLSNGRYSVMVTAAGSGYSRWNDLAITRWREDATRDDTGSYLLMRDVDTGRVWSAGYQPCAGQPGSYEVSFTEDRAEIIRSDGDIITTLEVQVSPEDDAEVRLLSMHQRLDARARNRSHRLMPSWCWRPRPRTWRTRHSRRCSCARNSSRARAC